jgi:hypothetical protein
MIQESNYKRKLPFRVSELARHLHLSRITLYKYFDLFDSLKEKLEISQYRSFELEDIAKVLDQKDVRFKKDRIEFLNRLSMFYWDSIDRKITHNHNHDFEQAIHEYIPSSLIEKNLNLNKLSNNFKKNKDQANIDLIFDDLNQLLPLKEFELMKVFSEFLKDNKEYNRQKYNEKNQQLIDYIEYLRFQIKKGK